MTSLRRRLVGRTTLVAVATIVPASIALYVLLRGELLSQFDEALLLEARSLQSHVALVRSEKGVNLEVIDLPHYDNPTNPWMFQIRHGETTEATSPGAEDHDFRPGPCSYLPTLRSTRLPDGTSGRMLFFRFDPQPPERDDSPDDPEPVVPPVEIVVARSTRELSAICASMRWILGIVNAVAISVIVGGIHRVARRELRPLSTLAAIIQATKAEGLSEPIVLTDPPEEVAPVIDRLNELLQRLDRAIVREKAFTADVAHELRTPLAGLLATLEVVSSRDRDAPVYRQTIADCLTAVRGMNSLVRTLLLLAREDIHRPDRACEPVGLAGLLRDCFSPFETMALEKRLRIDWQTDERIVWPTDRESLRSIASNLLDNAVSYVGVDGWIRIVTFAGETTGISIANDGCRLSPGDAENAFQRFWRGDESRSATGTHCGLGLSLCRKIAEGIGARLCATASDGVFEVRLEFARPASAGSPDTLPGAVATRIRIVV